jgi:hypothetical protein
MRANSFVGNNPQFSLAVFAGSRRRGAGRLLWFAFGQIELRVIFKAGRAKKSRPEKTTWIASFGFMCPLQAIYDKPRI